TPHVDGSPRFLDRSIRARRPLVPRRARRVLLPVASSSVLASPPQKGWPLLVSLNEAESGSLHATAHAFASRGFVRAITRTHARVAAWSTGNCHDGYLSIHKIGQASPGAPERSEGSLRFSLVGSL